MASVSSRKIDEVDISPIITEFQDFFKMYYKQDIEKLVSTYPKSKDLNVDYQFLERFNTDLADKLINEPDIIIYAAKNALIEMNYTLLPNITFRPHVRFFNLPGKDLYVENISSRHIGKLISVKGVVTKRAEVKHKVHVATYICMFCNEKTKEAIDADTVMPITTCPGCNRKGGMVLLEDESEFIDIQRAELQELLDRLKGSATPSRIELWIEDNLVNFIVPGDTLEVTGILRLRQPYIPKGRMKLAFIYTRYLDIVHITKQQREFEEIVITKEDEDKIRELSRSPKLYERLIKSVSPAIYGHNEIKEGIILQLFGGTTNKKLPGGGRIRDDIHILLIGDPGAAKCVSGDAEVLLLDGSLEKISNIVEEQLKKGATFDGQGYYAISNHDLLSLNIDGKIDDSKATVFWKVKSPAYLYEIQTSSGKSLTITPEHPLFLSQNGYISSKKASEVNKGEFIATPNYLPVKASPQKLPIPKKGRTNAVHPILPEYVTPGFARFLGYLVGDGYSRKTRTSYEMSFSNTDEILLDDFAHISSSFSLIPRKVADKRNNVKNIFIYYTTFGKIIEKMFELVNKDMSDSNRIKRMNGLDFILENNVK